MEKNTKVTELLDIFAPLTSLGVENLYTTIKDIESNDIITKQIITYIELLFTPVIIININNMIVDTSEQGLLLSKSSNYNFDHTKENVYDCLNIEATTEFNLYLNSLTDELKISFETLANSKNTIKISTLLDLFEKIIRNILDTTFTAIQKSYILVKFLYAIYEINILLFEDLMQKELLNHGESPSNCLN